MAEIWPSSVCPQRIILSLQSIFCRRDFRKDFAFSGLYGRFIGDGACLCTGFVLLDLLFGAFWLLATQIDKTWMCVGVGTARTNRHGRRTLRGGGCTGRCVFFCELICKALYADHRHARPCPSLWAACDAVELLLVRAPRNAVFCIQGKYYSPVSMGHTILGLKAHILCQTECQVLNVKRAP
jgi:hypothetical protein